MSVIRAFIAIDLTPEIQHRLATVSENYKTQLEGSPIRWVGLENIHLTLKFLGDVSFSNLRVLTDMLHTEVANHHQFDISVGGCGAFPNIRQPRVIWIGVEAPQELQDIQSGIDYATARLGYAREERAFSPHLTLGRVSRNASVPDIKLISQKIDKIHVGFLGAACIEEVHLYKSELKPTGSIYTRIFSSPLKA